MSKRHLDALEACLQALEQGETLDAALARFPALADELRPMLQASLRARTLAGPPPSDAIQRRGRARLLQRAAELREAKTASRRTWLFHLRPLAAAFMLVVFFLSGTRLVRASSTSLPGDNLYPVKRAWEGARLLFVFSETERDDLEMKYESERADEVRELLARGRIEAVSFSGYITSQADSLWMVSGIPVAVLADTVLPVEPVSVGSAVMVSGLTTTEGVLQAHIIALVPAGKPVPTPKPGDDAESKSGDEAGRLLRPETKASSPSGKKPKEPDDDSGKEKSRLVGRIESMSGNFWIVNGQRVDVSGAEITGAPVPGATVTIEGYLNDAGVFVATKVIFEGGGSGNGSSGDDIENESESDGDDKDGESDDNDDHDDDADADN